MYLLSPSLEFTRVKNGWVGNSVEECLKSCDTKRTKGMESCSMYDYMGLVPSKKIIYICGKSCSTFIPMFLSNQIHGHSLSLTGFQSFKKREVNGEFGHH